MPNVIFEGPDYMLPTKPSSTNIRSLKIELHARISLTIEMESGDPRGGVQLLFDVRKDLRLLSSE